jgi:hypothetical protein
MPGRAGPARCGAAKIIAFRSPPSGDISTMALPANRLFLVDRNDGFGARLAAMLDAMWLARQFDGRFAFHWPDTGVSQAHNAIEARTNVFAPRFLAEHHLEADRVASLRLRTLVSVPPDVEAALEAAHGFDGFRVQGGMLGAEARRRLGPARLASEWRAAFRSIGFSPALHRARRLAAAVPIARNTTALHLRAGDIVYGSYRASGAFHGRVIAYPVAFDLLRRRAEAGAPVLVFGQDRALCDHARRAWNALLAQDFADEHGFDAVAKALFEIALMARCREIIAGNSAFSLAAARIAGKRIRPPGSIVPAPEARALIVTALQDPDDGFAPSPLQKAMAAWHAVRAGGFDLDDPTSLAMIDAAIRHDPPNPFYRAVAAIARYRSGATAEAERLMLEALAGEQACPDLVRHLASWLHHAPVIADSATLALLAERARGGWPVAALLLALHARAARKPDDHQAYRCLYLAHRSAGMAPFPDDLLR